MIDKKQVPIDEELFVWPSDKPELLGIKCGDCNNTGFPVGKICSKCGGNNISTIGLKSKGTLWTWTSQVFRPKNLVDNQDPKEYKPFFLGYVELADQVIVQTRLMVKDPSQLTIGMPMELVIFKLREELDGTEVMTYGFKPE